MIELFEWRGFWVNARRNALPSSLVVWLLLAGGAHYGLAYAWGAALGLGLLAALIHWASEFWHHFGHWLAGKSVGYAMNGLTLVYALAIGRYPSDEPQLPAEVHIRRALGGPIISLLMTVMTGALAWALWPHQDAAAFLAAFAFLDNLLVFTLGSLLPLGFTDGSTLLYWWPRRNAQSR